MYDRTPLEVAFGVFRGFTLSEPEAGRLAEIVRTQSGPQIYQRILARAGKLSKDPWEQIGFERRAEYLRRALESELSSSEREALVLRTAACLILRGDIEFGARLIRVAPTIDWKTARSAPPKRNSLYASLAIAAAGIVVIVAALVAGLLWLVIPGLVILVIGGVVFLKLRGRSQLEGASRSQLERYESAMRRVDAGASPPSVFSPNGEVN